MVDMNSKLEWKGVFWLPDDPDEKVQGMFRYTPEEGIDLDLFGAFRGKLDTSSTAETVLLGVTEDGKKLTFLNCWQSAGSMSIPGFPISKVSALYCFIGEHFESAAAIQFDSIQVEFHAFGAWLDIYGFKKPEYKDGAKFLTVYYEQPPPIEFELPDGWKGRVDFFYHAPAEYFFPRASVTIEQRPGLTLIPAGKTKFSDFRAQVDRFSHFLTVCYFAYPGFVAMQGGIDKVSGETELLATTVDILYGGNLKSDHDKKRARRQNFLLTYTDMRALFAAAIKNWWRLENTVEASLDILVETFLGRTQPVELRFLILVQALENWHHRLAGADFVLRARLQAIVDGIPPLVRSALLDNEPNFIERVKLNRNYFTHYEERLEEEKSPLSELLVLAEKLRLILVICVLKELGFSDGDVEACMFGKGLFLFNHLISYDSGRAFRENLEKRRQENNKDTA